MMTCFFCKKELPVEGKVYRKDLCPHCSSPLRVCVNCRFFDRAAHNSCREPAAEWVRDKEKENFCDHFRPASASGSAHDEAERAAERAREQLNKLFG